MLNMSLMRAFGARTLLSKPTHQPKHKMKLRFFAPKEKYYIPEDLGGRSTLEKGPISVRTKTMRTQLYSMRLQPTPIHDYINFKVMSSNEILLNLENYEHFSHSELLGSLVELSTRDQIEQFDWNEHPWTSAALKELKARQPNLGAKHLAQT